MVRTASAQTRCLDRLDDVGLQDPSVFLLAVQFNPGTRQVPGGKALMN